MLRTITRYGLYIVLIYTVIMIGISQHEKTHVQIMSLMGCEDPYYEINYFSMEGMSTCLSNYTMTNQERELHGLNEVTGYNNIGIILAVLMAAFMICTTIEAKEGEE